MAQALSLQRNPRFRNWFFAGPGGQLQAKSLRHKLLLLRDANDDFAFAGHAELFAGQALNGDAVFFKLLDVGFELGVALDQGFDFSLGGPPLAPAIS